MQRRIHEFQAQSALKLELENEKRRQDELVFERKKREQEAKLETFRLEQEAAVSLARPKAIEEDLGLGHEQIFELPAEDPSQRLRKFINSQRNDITPQRYSREPRFYVPYPSPAEFPIKIEGREAGSKGNTIQSTASH